MVLGYNAYNSAIIPDNRLITDHNCYRIKCDQDPVIKPTPDQLVGGSNPTSTSTPGTCSCLPFSLKTNEVCITPPQAHAGLHLPANRQTCREPEPIDFLSEPEQVVFL